MIKEALSVSHSCRLHEINIKGPRRSLGTERAPTRAGERNFIAASIFTGRPSHTQKSEPSKDLKRSSSSTFCVGGLFLPAAAAGIERATQGLWIATQPLLNFSRRRIRIPWVAAKTPDNERGPGVGHPLFSVKISRGEKMRQGFHSNVLAGNLGPSIKRFFYLMVHQVDGKGEPLKCCFAALVLPNKWISYSRARKNSVKRQKNIDAQRAEILSENVK